MSMYYIYTHSMYGNHIEKCCWHLKKKHECCESKLTYKRNKKWKILKISAEIHNFSVLDVQKEGGKVRNSSEKKNVEHIAKIESITSDIQTFVTDIRIVRRKRQYRKKISSNISHHWCDFDLKLLRRVFLAKRKIVMLVLFVREIFIAR